MPLLGGCATLGYYLQAVNGQMDVIHRAQPIERVLADPTAAHSLKRKLVEVGQIRKFASKELGLPDNGTFRRYADLQRPFVVWNVFAAAEFSTQPKEWCYPLFGCANYRGYFSQREAETAAHALQQAGYDTYVSGIPAYSTLGWFDDPVLNTFVHYPQGQLAELMFHELAHQVVYVRGDTTFNESFAVTVAQVGTRRWLARSGTEEQRAAFEALELRRQIFAALVEKYRERLAEIYATALSDDRKRVRKTEAFQAMTEEYQKLKSASGDLAGYDKWFSQDLNNAQLASASLYTQLVPAFQRLLAREGGDLPRFYRAVKDIGALAKGQRATVLHRLTETGGCRSC
ncbi:MAG TPA: aminopeptidase [Thiobacillaceae bacterium]|nr:aminopeptidase [Thiobacillaceae bacterium]